MGLANLAPADGKAETGIGEIVLDGINNEEGVGRGALALEARRKPAGSLSRSWGRNKARG